MSAKDAAVQKDSAGPHAGKNTAGKEPRIVVGQSERSSKGTPLPTYKVPKLPPSPTLSGRLSKTPNSEPVKERKPLSVVPRPVSSENSKDFRPAWINGAGKRSAAFAKFKEAASKTASDLKIQVAVKVGDVRTDAIKSNETSPKLANGLKIAGSEENSDARRKHKETSPQYSLGSDKKASGKASSPTLCSECRAASEGAVCFIGNDGRVSACTSRSAVRLCKNLNCAANNPEYVAFLASAPKKYLVSKRHLLKAQPAPKIKGGQPKSPRIDQNSESSFPKADETSALADLPSAFTLQADRNQHSKERLHDTVVSDDEFCLDQDNSPEEFSFREELEDDEQIIDKSPEEFSFQEELEDDEQIIDDGTEYHDDGGTYSGSLDMEGSDSKLSSIGSDTGDSIDKLKGRRLMSDSQKMRRRSIGVIEKQDPETVTLRKQLIQERKQAGEWMVNYAIGETVHKLAPTGEPKVKVLVQAFERIISHTDGEAMNSPDGPRTPENQVPLCRSITFNS